MEDKSPRMVLPETDSADPGAVPTFSVQELADQLYRKRKGRGLTLGQASRQIGVSAATLSRLERHRQEHAEGLERGAFVPDTRTLTAVARWLGMPVGRVADDGTGAPTPVNQHADESVPDKVEAHLRADSQLDNESALALAQLFRMAYDQFSRLHRAETAADQPADRKDVDEQEASR